MIANCLGEFDHFWLRLLYAVWENIPSIQEAEPKVVEFS